jgi:hypothetical protein
MWFLIFFKLKKFRHDKTVVVEVSYIRFNQDLSKDSKARSLNKSAFTPVGSVPSKQHD